MQRSYDYNRLAFFSAVYDTGSFTLAAARMGVSKSVVSKQIAWLERDFEVVLFDRTTRMVRPTKAAMYLYKRHSRIMRAAEKAFSELSSARQSLRRYR